MEHYQAQGDTVNYQTYCVLLKDKLNPTVGTKRRGMLLKNVFVLHDNARNRTSLAAEETTAELKFEVPPDPDYSRGSATV